jgi:hypothetical protein
MTGGSGISPRLAERENVTIGQRFHDMICLSSKGGHMFPAAHSAGLRRWNLPPILLFLTLSTTLALAACSAPASAPAKPTDTSSAKPAAPTAASAKPSPGASPAAKPSPSPSASPVALIEIVDATLADATPWVSLRLSDGEPRIVSGWRLEVGSQAVVVPGNAILQPGESLFLHVGDGMSSDREIFLGAESQALALAASPGTVVRLVNTAGEVVAQTTVPRY